MAGSSNYQIHVEGLLDDSKIRASLRRIEAQMGKMKFGAGARGGKGGAAYFEQTSKAAKKASKDVNTFAGGVKKAHLNLLDVGKKVVAFGAVTSAIQMASTGMKDLLVQVKTVDDSLTELKKVSDLSTSGLEQYTQQAAEAGKATGRTAAEMLDAST